MTREAGTLRLRLLAAFVGVAAVAIAAFAGLTLWAGRGDVAALVRRQQQATLHSTTAALADAYRGAGGWTGADLRPAHAVAVSGGGLLEVRDASGTLVLQAGRGPAWMRPASGYGAARSTPVVVGGASVGTASVRFPSGTLPPAERQLRDALTRTTAFGVAIAAAVALVVGLVVADGIARPLRRLTGAVRRVAGGDLSARANLRAPGELGELGAAVDAMASSLEREDALRRGLTADVAHELRTPVTILAAQCEALVDGVDEPTPERLASLAEEVQRLGRVIEDLEALASADAASVRLDRERVDLAALVERTAELLRPQFAGAGVALATRLGPAAVDGDETRLAQIVRNLLSNAVKFTPSGGRVDVTLSASDGAVELAVADTGAGIPADELPHVFDRFWRGSSAAGTAGSGVGLAVAAQLARVHGGSLAAASGQGRGATFTLRLPRA